MSQPTAVVTHFCCQRALWASGHCSLAAAHLSDVSGSQANSCLARRQSQLTNFVVGGEPARKVQRSLDCMFVHMQICIGQIKGMTKIIFMKTKLDGMRYMQRYS